MSNSNIVDFFTGKTVFLTGGTGFLGQLTLERLLRVCRVQLVYLLIRQKKGKSEEERLMELFDAEVFEPLKTIYPDFKNRIKLITGNCNGTDLDIDPDNWKALHDQVEIVIHCAATVRFDQSLRTAYNINVRAVRDLILHARRMKKLQSFIHVSTAYSNCADRELIEEKVYDPPMTAEQLGTYLELFPDDAFVKKTEKSILENIPNTYTYTKCLAEELVKRLSKDPKHPLPISIVRPSIIVSSFKDPLPGWINNVYGPAGVSLTVALGLLRTLHCVPEKKADMVPVDYVVNALLVVAWETAQKATPDVYNYTSGKHSIDWNTYMHLNHKEGEAFIPMVILWVPFIYLNRYLFMHKLYWFFLHTLPAHIVDGILRILQKKPMLVDGYKKIARFCNVISYFACREWQMPHEKILKIYERMTEKDQELFELRMSTLDWPTFAKVFMPGGRVYLLKEPLSNLPAAQRRFKWIQMAHYVLKWLVISGILWAIYWILWKYIMNN